MARKKEKENERDKLERDISDDKMRLIDQKEKSLVIYFNSLTFTFQELNGLFGIGRVLRLKD